MTISSSNRKAGPFTGNGVTVAFPFAFKVFTTADVLVVQAVTATGVETTLALGTNYTVSLNADQNANPGGTITMLVAPPTGYTLTATSQVGNLQPMDLTNAGGFYPKVLNDAADRAAIQIQQLAEGLSRAVQVPISSATLPTEYLSVMIALEADATSSAADAQASEEAALATLNDFKGRYYGALAADPVLDPLGADCGDGDLYFNTTTKNMRVYRSGAWSNYEDAAAASATASEVSRLASGASAAAALVSEGNAETSEAAALAAKAAAEAARDAALIQSGVYVDEPTGRAAVADGVAFKVQGSGDVAAYEYRRVSAGVVSTLIAIYPSSALVAKLAAGDFSTIGFGFEKLAAETGYAWGLTDELRMMALGVRTDGAVEAPKLLAPTVATTDPDMLYTRTPQVLSNESGYVWAIVDAAGKIALAINAEGAVFGNFTALTSPGAAYLQPSKNLYFIGDSLTAGAGGQVTWREALPALVSARVSTTIAVGGETSTQQAAKCGAYVTLLTLSGNQIPASGAVAVTARTISVLSSQGAQSIEGAINGVPGTLTRASDDSYTFTRTAAGSVVNVGAKMPFVPNISGHDFDTLLIFIGRNNLGAPDDIKRDIAACVALQKTTEKRFLILTPTNGGSITAGVSTTEGTGSGTLTNIKLIEDWAVQTYGDRVIKLREYSFQFNNGGADDLDDVAKETVPRSLRIDTVHFTTAFHAHIAAYVASEINRKGW